MTQSSLVLHLPEKQFLFSFEGTCLQEKRICGRIKAVYTAGVNDGEVPPVPIPNTVVKLIYVENTWRETAWEDR